MKRILIALEDSEQKQKEEKLLNWLKEENISTEALETYVQEKVASTLENQTENNKEELKKEIQSELETQHQEKLKKTSKKMRIVAVVSLGVILIMGGFAFFQMLETDKLKDNLKESVKESLLHRQVVEQLQDSIIAREMRYKSVNNKQLPLIRDTTDTE